MICRDDLPETPDWICEPKCCPFESCGVCETSQQAIWRHLPDGVELGEN